MLLVLGAAVLGAERRELAPRVLDLTGPGPKEEESRGKISGAVGGSTAENREPPQPLPLDLSIRSVDTKAGTLAGELVIELLLRNTGRTPYLLPVSRVSRTAFRADNTARREFNVKVRLYGGSRDRPLDDYVAALFGSETVPESLWIMQPQDAVLMRIPARVDWNVLVALRPLREVALSVVCGEWGFEGPRSFLRVRFGEVESSNRHTVALPPE
jgi:hypothetical protein